MKVYRVEDPYRKFGIWRDFDETVDPVFKYLSDGKCKDMPMENSDFYREGGKNWFSATDTHTNQECVEKLGRTLSSIKNRRAKINKERKIMQ